MDVNKTEGQTPQTTGQSGVPQPAEQEGGRAVSSPTRSFMSLRDDLDKFFDSMLLSPLSRSLLDIDLFRRHGLVSDLTPRMDVVETPQAVELSAELPGIREEDLDISVVEGVITIRGEKKMEQDRNEAGFHLS